VKCTGIAATPHQLKDPNYRGMDVVGAAPTLAFSLVAAYLGAGWMGGASFDGMVRRQ
jgi:hypothetical protein